MAEVIDGKRDWKSQRAHVRAMYGVECAGCLRERPNAPAEVLLPGDTCGRKGHEDPRPRMSRAQLGIT